NASLSVTGGKDNTRFLAGGSYHRETNVFSTEVSDKRISLNFNITHKSTDKRFSLQISGSYASDQNDLIQNDLTQFINLPPNFEIYDSTGKPNWTQKGVPINYLDFSFGSVPAAELLKKYSSINDNL